MQGWRAGRAQQTCPRSCQTAWHRAGEHHAVPGPRLQRSLSPEPPPAHSGPVSPTRCLLPWPCFLHVSRTGRCSLLACTGPISTHVAQPQGTQTLRADLPGHPASGGPIVFSSCCPRALHGLSAPVLSLCTALLAVRHLLAQHLPSALCSAAPLQEPPRPSWGRVGAESRKDGKGSTTHRVEQLIVQFHIAHLSNPEKC